MSISQRPPGPDVPSRPAPGQGDADPAEPADPEPAEPAPTEPEPAEPEPAQRTAVDERLTNLTALTDTTLNRLSVTDLFAELLDRLRAILEVDTVAVLMLDENGEYLHAHASLGLEEEVHQGVRVPVGTGFAGTIAARRQPVTIDQVDQSTVSSPILWERGIQAMLGVPMLRDEELIGVVHVGRLDARPFTDDDTQLLMVAAERIVGAATAQQLASETAAAKLMERSLLPDHLPTVPGAEFAGRYVPAADRMIGGDWYDVFVLPDGALWLVIGDVVGHGLPSAVTMGRVRSTLRAYALLGEGPAPVLEMTDRKVNHFEMGAMTTVLCAVAHPPYESFEFASAGHPAPALAVPGNDAVLVPVDTNPPLGAAPGIARTSIRTEVPLGSVLMLYTDGLVEDRESSITEGMERLRQEVRPEHPELLCRLAMRRMVGSRTPDDDIAMLVMRRIAVTS